MFSQKQQQQQENYSFGNITQNQGIKYYFSYK